MKFSHVLLSVIFLVAAAVFTYWVITVVATAIGIGPTLLVAAGIVLVSYIIYRKAQVEA